MTALIIPLPENFEEPLVKAAKLALQGEWAGLPIIAVGPKGGKIVGYNAKGKPIYAGSKQAEKMAQAKAIKQAPTAGAVWEWLKELGYQSKILGKLDPLIRMAHSTAEIFVEHFPEVKSKVSAKTESFTHFKVKDLVHLVGQMPAPKGEQVAHFQAKAAAGELDKDPFPPLQQLKEVPAGKVAGSHQNRLFQSPDGRKWVFKHENAIMARAEEAADRISRLILGEGKAPAAKHVKLGGKSGVLIEFLPGEVLNDQQHSNPPTEALQQHFDQVVQHHVVDWLISNHDGHAGNFLIDKKGLSAFDKGQAWKFFGKDELSATYSPNPSNPIYVKFWKLYQQGELKGDPIKAAQAALDIAGTITIEQYRSLIAPYIQEVAKQKGMDAQALQSKLEDRLINLRSDWEGFLSKVTGAEVKLSISGEDNFETMPVVETEPVEKEKKVTQLLALLEPGKPKVMEDTAVKPPSEKVAGWPIQKGKDTIHHPGTPPPPEAKWPKGYPGPGFLLEKQYKGQTYFVEFVLHGETEFGAFVTFPDGLVQEFPSPNAASDALVLFNKGLPLTLSATQKKKAGISYPAGKAFGLHKFKAELAQSYSVDPAELTEKFTVQPPEVSAAKQPAPKIDAEKAGFVVPADAPTTYAGPLPPGASKTVSKKFNVGKRPVKLTVLDDGTFDVTIYEADGKTLAVEPQTFQSLSAASDWVWVNQKGYKNATVYKQATGKKKVPSGGGWKFWGVDPAAISAPGPVPVAPSPTPEPAAPTKPGAPNWKWFEDHPGEELDISGFLNVAQGIMFLSFAPVGAVVRVTDKKTGKTNRYSKREDGQWQGVDPDAAPIVQASTLADWIANFDAFEFHASLPTAEPEWTPIEKPMSYELDKMPVYTHLRMTVEGKDQYWRKSPSPFAADKFSWVIWHDGKWRPGGSLVVNLDSATSFAQAPSNVPEGTSEKDAAKIPPPGIKAPVEKPPTPKAPKTKKPKPTKVGKAKLITKANLPDMNLPAEASALLNSAMDTSWKWATDDTPSGVMSGAKSAKWAGWVPPPGVFIEGTYTDPLTGLDKRYWLTTARAGYDGETGAPWPHVGLAIIDSEGTVNSVQYASASKTLKEAAKAFGLPQDTKTLKEIFNLKGVYFAPGETIKTVQEGTGPSAIPSLPQVQKTAAADTPKADKPKPVKVSLTLGQAFETKLPQAKVVPVGDATGQAMLVVPTQLGQSSAQAKGALEGFFQELGLPVPEGIVSAPAGAYATVPGTMVQDEVVVTLPHYEAASQPTPSHDNWETMPEGVDKVMKGTASVADIQNALDVMPLGTEIAALVGPDTTGIFQKVGDDKILVVATGEEWPVNEAANYFHGDALKITPPEGETFIPPTPEKVVAAKEVVQKIQTSVEQQKKAKELAAWAKENPAIGPSSEAQLVLSHLQTLAPKTKLWARFAADGELLLGTEKVSSLNRLWKKLTGTPGTKQKTPLGTFRKVSIVDLKAALPGKPADTITGPDNKVYPSGTTFEEEKITTSLEEAANAQLTKVVPHQTDADRMMLKLVGTDTQQREQLKAFLDQYDLTYDDNEILVGGQYTMIPLAKSTLAQIVKTETRIIPSIPPQPKPFVARSLPGFGGAARDGEEATNNRGDLAVLDTIPIPRTGHWVRCGKYGLFHHGQLQVRKVRRPDGKLVYEVTGMLHNPDKVLSDGQLSTENVVFQDGWAYDEATGAIVQSGKDSIRSFLGRSGKTEAGSKVEIINTPGYQAMHGVFRVSIDEGKDVEQELAHAFQRMGLDPAEALAEPTEADERLWIKHQVWRSLAGTQGYRTKDWQDEKWLTQAIKNMGGESLLQNARIEYAGNGKQCVVIDDPKDQAKQKEAGVRFLYVQNKSVNMVHRVLRWRSGASSMRTRWLSGSRSEGASTNSDLNGGGTWAVFTRYGNAAADGSSWGNINGNSGVRMVFHPRILKRTDWYAFSSDEFGKWAINKSKGRQQTYSHSGYTNEVCFEDNIGPRDIAGVVVDSQSKKDELIKRLKQDGITEYNNIPVEDFILVNKPGDKSRSYIADNLRGLQEGVLP